MRVSDHWYQVYVCTKPWEWAIIGIKFMSVPSHESERSLVSSLCLYQAMRVSDHWYQVYVCTKPWEWSIIGIKFMSVPNHESERSLVSSLCLYQAMRVSDHWYQVYVCTKPWESAIIGIKFMSASKTFRLYFGTVLMVVCFVFHLIIHQRPICQSQNNGQTKNTINLS